MSETVESIMAELEANGSQSIKKVLYNHGAKDPFFGVKIEYLKKIEKRVKSDYEMALGLYATGISDAMYLAGLICDDPKMTRENLQTWVEGAYWSLLSESTVPWVSSGSNHGFEMAQKWIRSDVDTIACAGWCTLSCLALIRPDDQLDLDAFKDLQTEVSNTIHESPNRVRYSMNGFIFSSGVYITPLTDHALECANKIGKVSVMMGNTACGVSFAPDSIAAAVAKGKAGKKKKTAKC